MVINFKASYEVLIIKLTLLARLRHNLCNEKNLITIFLTIKYTIPGGQTELAEKQFFEFLITTLWANFFPDFEFNIYRSCCSKKKRINEMIDCNNSAETT